MIRKLTFYVNKYIEISIITMTLIIPIIFFTRTNDVFEINKMFVFRFFTVFIVILWILKIFLTDKKIILKKTDFDFPIVGFLVVSFITTIITKNIYVSIYGVYEDFEGILTILNYIILYFIIVNFVKNINQVYKILISILIASIIISLYGLAQNFGWDFIKWNPATYSPDRFFSTLGNPNFLAAYLVEAIPILFILFFITHNMMRKMIVLFVLLASIIVLFFTKSRAGMLSFLTTIFLISIYSYIDSKTKANELFKKNKVWFIGFGILFFLSLFTPKVQHAFNLLWERSKMLFSLHGITMTPRLYIWKSALLMFKDYPIFGTGLDTFQVMFPYYRLPIYWRLEWNGTPEKTHNIFLQVLATQGILGFSFYILLMFSFLKKSFNLIFKEENITKRYLIFGIFLAVIGFIVQGLFNYTVVAYGYVFWLSLGLVIIMESKFKGIYVYDFSNSFKYYIDKNKNIVFAFIITLCIILTTFLVRFWMADIFYKIGNIGVNGGKYIESINFYKKATALNPYREIYWVKYGIAYERSMKMRGITREQRLNFIKKAEEIHLHTIKMNPMNGYNYNNLARVYKFYGEVIDKSKLDDAIKYYNEAIKRDPNNAYFGLDLATVYMAKREWNKAIEICKRYSKLYPRFGTPLSYIAYIYMLMGKQYIDKAKYYYEKASSDDKVWHNDIVSQASTYSNLGIIYANLNMIPKAIKMFEKSVKVRPNYKEGYLNIGLLYSKIGKYKEAMYAYEKVLQIDPNEKRALEPLNRLKKMLGE